MFNLSSRYKTTEVNFVHTALLNAVAKNGCNISQPKYKKWSIRDTFLLFNPRWGKADKRTEPYHPNKLVYKLNT
jgi:hypothetical protein